MPTRKEQRRVRFDDREHGVIPGARSNEKSSNRRFDENSRRYSAHQLGKQTSRSSRRFDDRDDRAVTARTDYATRPAPKRTNASASQERLEQVKEKDELDKEDEIWDDVRGPENDARRARLEKRWSTPQVVTESEASEFCISIVVPWLTSNTCNSSVAEKDHIKGEEKQRTAAADKRDDKKMCVDFGCGANLEDTSALALALNPEKWRVVAIEPYVPLLSILKRTKVPSSVEFLQRDFLAGTGLCQRWWRTPIDVFYARHVFCSLETDAERLLLWQFVETKVKHGGTIALQVCRDAPPFDEDSKFNEWLEECNNRGFEVQKVCNKRGYVVAIKKPRTQ